MARQDISVSEKATSGSPEATRVIRHLIFGLASFSLIISYGAVRASANEEDHLRIELKDKDLKSFSGLIYSFKTNRQFGVRFQGASSSLKLADLKMATFDWEAEEAKVVMKDGGEYKVHVRPLQELSASTQMGGIPIGVRIKMSAIQALTSVDSPDTTGHKTLPASKGLFATFVEDGKKSLPLMIGSTDDEGTYEPLRTTFHHGGGGSIHGLTKSSLDFDITETFELDIPLAYVKSLSVTEKGDAKVRLISDNIIEGHNGNLADNHIDKRFHGLVEGNISAKNTSTAWRELLFNWGDVTSKGTEKGTDLTNGKWWDIAFSDGSTALIYITRLRNEYGTDRRLPNFVMRGMELDSGSISEVSRCTFYPAKNHASIVLKSGELMEGTVETWPAAVEGYVSVGGSIALRFVASVASIHRMDLADADRRPRDPESFSKQVSDFRKLAEPSKAVVWKLVDETGRTWVVTDLNGYQPGKDYDSPPAGYRWTGGIHRETALVGGNLIAVQHRLGVLHIPIALVSGVDFKAKRAMFESPLKFDTPTMVKGFVTENESVYDVDDYLMLKKDLDSLVVTGRDTRGKTIYMPAEHIRRIDRYDGEFQRAADDSANLKYSGALEVTTTEGKLRIAEAQVEYRVPYLGTNAVTGAIWLAVGKDENNDDPRVFELEKIVVQLTKGPVIAVDLKEIVSVRRHADKFEVEMADDKYTCSLVPFEINGEGPFGKLAVNVKKIQDILVLREE